MSFSVAAPLPAAVPIGGHVCPKPLDFFKPDQRELDRHDDPEKTRLLGQNMLANGQLQAVGATEDGRLIFGHGRWLAAKSAGIKSLEVKLFPASLPSTQFKLIRASENLQRKDLTGYQKWVLCAELMADNPTWQMKDLAAHLHIDASMATRLLSPSKAIKAWQDALKEGTVGITDCYQASQLPQDQQAGLLALKLSGASRDEIAAHGRKARTPGNGSSSAVKVAKAKLALPSGVQIVISAPDLTLDSLIDYLGEAEKEAKRSRNQGLNIETHQAVSKDKAKKGE